MENLFEKYRVWAQVNLDALLHNYREMLKASGGTPVMPVIKADAYGQGATAIARVLQQKEGVRRFAVVTQEEALQLRKDGIEGLILVMGAVPVNSVPALQRAGISLCVPTPAIAQAYSEKAAGAPLNVHVKLDTGMSRLGMREETAVADILAIAKLPGLTVEGVFTQLSSSDLPGEDTFTRDQYDRFCRVVAALEQQGLSIPLRHCANSAATMGLPATRQGMVRNGLSLYGYQSREEDLGFNLQPILSWATGIVQVKAVPAGGSVGYDRGYKTEGDKRIATVPVGYADGLSRALSLGKGNMLVRGHSVPIVGKICMDMCMLDVTDVPGVAAGDLVTILGQDGTASITADDMAATLGTISYEVLCNLGKRVPRVYSEDGVLDIDHPYWCGY